MRTPDQIRDVLASVLPGVRADLEDLVRIPSVSADPSATPTCGRAPNTLPGSSARQG